MVSRCCLKSTLEVGSGRDDSRSMVLYPAQGLVRQRIRAHASVTSSFISCVMFSCARNPGVSAQVTLLGQRCYVLPDGNITTVFPYNTRVCVHSLSECTGIDSDMFPARRPVTRDFRAYDEGTLPRLFVMSSSIHSGRVNDAIIVTCGASLSCLSGVVFWSYSRKNPHAQRRHQCLWRVLRDSSVPVS